MVSLWVREVVSPKNKNRAVVFFAPFPGAQKRFYEEHKEQGLLAAYKVKEVWEVSLLQAHAQTPDPSAGFDRKLGVHSAHPLL